MRDNTNSVEPPIHSLLRPFQIFARLEAGSGILLLLCMALALIWANSPWAGSYFALWETQVTVAAGGLTISKPLLLWINDGLMAVFFFVVGLEIKREVLTGELSTLRQAALPVAAAIGGMIFPALIYVALNAGGGDLRGWGVPMATDIAFALGVMALLGPRVPLSLKVFLTAFAIVDDIGAVLVIALFYTEQLSGINFIIAHGILLLAILANRSGVRNPLVYLLLGIAMWIALLKSGVHATVAGVLMAMTIPASSRIDPKAFLRRVEAVLNDFRQAEGGDEYTTTADQQDALHTLEEACENVQAPLQRIEHGLHPWVSFAIMPLFALANAGVALTGSGEAATGYAMPLGIILGLVIGKPLGVTLCAWLAVRVGVASLPEGVTWRHIHGAGWLGGIGFTMALFIAGLAFDDSASLAAAKIGILAASFLAGIVGFALLRKSASTASA